MRRETRDGEGKCPGPRSPAVDVSRLPSHETPTIHVACGALINTAGEALLAQRPEGKIAAGYWEFPGGKIEPGESPHAALQRELHEELGIDVTSARPLIRFTHHYSNRSIVLDTWLISAWQGEPHGREDQALQWLPPSRFAEATPLLPTVAPIAAALALPQHYVFTPEAASLERLIAGLPQLPKAALLRLRQAALTEDEYLRRAALLLPAARALGLKLIVDCRAEQALALGADGWHATAQVLSQCALRPALPLCLASVHGEQELARAAALGFNAAVAGPVLPTATHPGATTLGWAGFTELATSAAMPVFAIGGLGGAHLNAAFAAYAQGVAGISAWWAAPQK